MSKQDRQGVRKASDLEQKYNFGMLAGQGNKSNEALARQINTLNQSFAQFGATVLGRINELEKKIDDLTIGYTVTFLVDGAVYEKVSVKAGNSVSAPETEPTSESGTFVAWQLNGEDVTFPFTPTGDTEITAVFQ